MAKSKSKSNVSTAVVSHSQFWRDIKTSLLVVSLLANAFIVVGWMVLKMTNQYDGVLVTTLLNR